MNVVNIPPEDRFYKNILILSEILYNGFNELKNLGYTSLNPSMIDLVMNIISSFDKKYLITAFIKKSHEKFWDKIKLRDEEYFIENSHKIFDILPMKNLDVFKELYLSKDEKGNSIITDDQKDDIWNLLDALVKISIKFVHENRDPQSIVKDGKTLLKYNKEFLNDVNIEYHKKEWGLNLTF